jgi:hypothetical protein
MMNHEFEIPCQRGVQGRQELVVVILALGHASLGPQLEIYIPYFVERKMNMD